MAGLGGGETLTAKSKGVPVSNLQSPMTTLADPSAKLLLKDQLASHAEKAMVILCKAMVIKLWQYSAQCSNIILTYDLDLVLNRVLSTVLLQI